MFVRSFLWPFCVCCRFDALRLPHPGGGLVRLICLWSNGAPNAVAKKPKTRRWHSCDCLKAINPPPRWSFCLVEVMAIWQWGTKAKTSQNGQTPWAWQPSSAITDTKAKATRIPLRCRCTTRNPLGSRQSKRLEHRSLSRGCHRFLCGGTWHPRFSPNSKLPTQLSPILLLANRRVPISVSWHTPSCFWTRCNPQRKPRNLLGESPSQEMIELFSSEKQVTKDTPPTFLFHTMEDKGVPPENSIAFYSAMLRNGVPGNCTFSKKANMESAGKIDTRYFRMVARVSALARLSWLRVANQALSRLGFNSLTSRSSRCANSNLTNADNRCRLTSHAPAAIAVLELIGSDADELLAACWHPIKADHNSRSIAFDTATRLPSNPCLRTRSILQRPSIRNMHSTETMRSGNLA